MAGESVGVELVPVRLGADCFFTRQLSVAAPISFFFVWRCRLTSKKTQPGVSVCMPACLIDCLPACRTDWLPVSLID